MGKKAPGRSHREGISILELARMFPDDRTAEAWFEKQRWPNDIWCPDCGSFNCAVVKSRKPMPYRCRDCRAHFSVRKGTVMQSSKLGLQKWAFAVYLMSSGIKGTASMKIARDLGIPQKTAWFLMQRIREGFVRGMDKPFPGPVEVDETFIGGKERNKHSKKRHRIWSPSEGKAIVAGVRDRPSKQISAAVVEHATRRPSRALSSTAPKRPPRSIPTRVSPTRASARSAAMRASSIRSGSSSEAMSR